MDFRIVIDQTAVAAQSQASQQPAPGQPLPAPAGTPAPPLSAAQLAADEHQRLLRDWTDRRSMRQERFAADPASQEAGRQLADELDLGRRRLEVLRERYRQDTAAAEAGRRQEEEMVVRQRQLEVLRERHRLDGAAVEEARLRLEYEKEARQWQQRVNEERRRQDPAAAMGEDLQKLGGFLGQSTGGKGIGGLLGRLMQMAPRFQEQFGELFGGNDGGGGDLIGRLFGGGGSGAQAARQASTSQATGQAADIARQFAASQQGIGAASSAGATRQAAQMAGIGQQAAGAGAGAAGAGAGAAGGALGAAAAAAGPAGLAVEAVNMVTDFLADEVKKQTESIKKFGSELRMVASNDYLGAFTARVDSAAEGLRSLGGISPVAKIFAAQVELFNEHIKQAALVVDAFVRRGQALEAYSGDLAVARSLADIRSMLADMREASSIGGALARLTEAQNQLSTNVRDLMMPLKRLETEGIALLTQMAKSATDGIHRALVQTGVLRDIDEIIGRMFLVVRKIALMDDDKIDDTLDALIAGNFGRNQSWTVPFDPGVNVPVNPGMPPPPPPIGRP